VSEAARVTAVPDKGKANKALLKLLAAQTGLAYSAMSVIAGGQSRNKMVLIEGEPQELEKFLTSWLASLG
jgi:hypothetical protein